MLPFELLDCFEVLVNAVCFGLMSAVEIQQIYHEAQEFLILLHSADGVVQNMCQRVLEMEVRWEPQGSFF